MQLTNFYENTKRLMVHCGKNLSQAQLEQLFRQIEEIGDQAYTSIVDSLLTELKMIPSAFPTVGRLMQDWYAYRRAHASYHYDQPDPCEFCNGSGVTTVLTKHPIDGDRLVENMAFCSECKNWRRVFSPVAIQEVCGDGVVVDIATRDAPGGRFWIQFVTPRPGGRKPPGNYKQRNVQDLLDGIGGVM